MGFLDLFKKKVEEDIDVLDSNIPTSSTPSVDVQSDRFQKLFTSEEKPETTGYPIYELYSRLAENYEKKGLQDALENPDTLYKEQQKEIIISDIQILCRKLQTLYEDRILLVNAQIDHMRQSGFIETTEKLNKTLELFNSHITKIKEIEKEILDRGRCASFIVNTYEQGFKKGVSEYCKNEVEKAI
ncbi:MAG: hypothetical protein IJY36_07985 [Coprobacter sp.]|nr:hypothetical protein [Coprobacter sp.]